MEKGYKSETVTVTLGEQNAQYGFKDNERVEAARMIIFLVNWENNEDARVSSAARLELNT